MNHPWLLEAALRSLLMGATIFVVLKAFRIRQVRAERTAWVLALLAAIAMPALMHWPVGPQLLRSRASSLVPSPLSHRTHVEASSVELPQITLSRVRSVRTAHSVHQAAPLIPAPKVTPAVTQPSATHRIGARMQGALAVAMPYAVAFYSCVAFLLLARLALGVTLALRIRSQAVRAPWYLAASNRGDDIRISSGLHTPATIASSIVLPASSEDWDAPKLRMVLAHERAHVQQSDFYIHLLAGMHCAIFWFSPFAWWLQRRLSALGEAMSDLAALQQAESRSSYAEVLLEFATAARQPMAAVSMARSSNLRPRIERLLNDKLFRDAFSAKRRHPFLAAGIVPIALLASASLVRVHAAVQTAPPTPKPSAAIAPAPTPAVQAPQALAPVSGDAPGAQALPAPEAATEPAAAVIAEPAAPSLKLQPLPPMPRVPQLALNADLTLRMKSAMDAASQQLVISQTNAMRSVLSQRVMALQVATLARVNMAVDSDWDGDSFALVSGDESTSYSFNGSWNKAGRFDAIRRAAKGDFIYYEHDGKSYVIQDPALIAKAKALYAPMQALSKQQEELGHQQEALGRQQEELGRKQEGAKVPTPDLSKELASLEHAMQELKQLQANKEATQESLANVQEEIGDIQGKLGELQGKAGDAMGKVGEEQGALGEQQGKLGEKQGRLGEEQGKIAEEAQRQMKPLLDEAIKDGRAKPVE